MILVLIMFLLLGLYKVKYLGVNKNYINKHTTTCVNGFFILLVFISHSLSYMVNLDWGEVIVKNVIGLIGQLMVAPFLFNSGFGVMESITNKAGYAKSIFKRRLLPTLFRFDLALLLYVLLNLCLGIQFPASNYIFCWIGLKSIGNSNWYIFIIMCLYFCTWLFAVVFDRLNISFNWLFAPVLCSAILIAVCLRLVGFSNYWYDTILCFSVGMIYSVYRTHIEEFIENNIKYVCVLCICVALFIVFYLLNSLPMYEIAACFFCFIIVLLCYRFNFGNKGLYWLGNHLFEIYILQRLPMIFLANLGLNNSPLLFWKISFAVTILLAFAGHYIFDKYLRVTVNKETRID